MTYNDPKAEGKSAQNTDTYHGYFKNLVQNQKIVEVMEFESKSSDLSGEMTITTDLYHDENGGTKIVITHENLPLSVPADQNEIGWRTSLNKLADLLRT